MEVYCREYIAGSILQIEGKNPETDDRFRQLSGFFSYKLVNDENPQNIVDIVDNCVDNYGEKSGMLWNAGRRPEKPKAVPKSKAGKVCLDSGGSYHR